MEKYLLIIKVKNKENPSTNELRPMTQFVNANSFGKAEKKIIKRWNKLNCDVGILSISVYN